MANAGKQASAAGTAGAVAPVSAAAPAGRAEHAGCAGGRAAQAWEASIDAAIAARTAAPTTHADFDRLVRLMWRFRQPDGCPWDLEQTHCSTTKHFLEEGYEAIDAIEAGTREDMVEELGDVLEQVLLQAQIAADEGAFTIDDVCRALASKLIRRHPHVFGEYPCGDAGEDDGATAGSGAGGASAGAVGANDNPNDALNSTAADAQKKADAVQDALQDAAAAQDPDAVQAVWERVKQRERAAKERVSGKEISVFDSIPLALPALMSAQKHAHRAGKLSMLPCTATDVQEKIAIAERAYAAALGSGAADAANTALGELLFLVVCSADAAKLDAETSLRTYVHAFRRACDAAAGDAAAGEDR